MIVMKFGGTSVESQQAIERVTRIVQSYEERRPVVVVSAMGKTTNKLLEAAREAAAGRREQALAIVDELRALHLTHGLPLAGSAAAELDRYIRAHFEWLDELVKGLSVVGELSPRSMDAIASVGERLSSLVVSFAFRAAGLRTQHVDARRVIVTDDRFTQAQPLFEETYALLQEDVTPIAETSVVVMGGFIGSTKNGQTTTLGRGGSDYSASIVGAGINAEEIQIWTDVDGMLTADPRIIPNGRRVKSISFAEASEMAYFGAKVLHPATVLPAVEKNIPVRILNSRRADINGTIITSEPVPCRNPVKSISCKRGITILNIHSTRMLMAHGFLRRIFELFDRYGTSVDMVSTSEVSVSLTIDNRENLDAICRELREFAEASSEDGQAIICLIGENIRHTPGIAGRAFQVLQKKNIRMISQGASLLNLGFVVSENELEGAVAALHDEFFSELDPAVFD
ncbi:MAG: lysine-sensitive aspartokinase 3 [Acidobacteriaceae bacterium]|nr:lysine-sensitive aspartokinase 3 [Acidobacteriaceae bacterium]MBV9765322.1 lysine-sensitive aspartokinase 3 [Acidobacteriaceae bacterium]